MNIRNAQSSNGDMVVDHQIKHVFLKKYQLPFIRTSRMVVDHQIDAD
jgi:hypothetical protein